MELTKDISKPKYTKKKNIQPLIFKDRAFGHASKKNVAFAIDAIHMDTSTEMDVQEIPTQYHNFKDVFEKSANILSEHCLYDCAIELQDGAQPPFGPIYNLSQTELATLYDYSDENLSKNFI